MKRSVESKDVIAILALIVSATGLFFAGTQMQQADRTERGKFFKELYSPFFLDDQIRYVYELIEKGDPIFHDKFGTKKEQEQLKRQRAVERLFAHFEIIGSLYYRELLSRDDLVQFDYNIQRVCLTEKFDEYVSMLEEWRKLRGLSQGPYSNFLRYVNENRSRLCERSKGTTPMSNNALHPEPGG